MSNPYTATAPPDVQTSFKLWLAAIVAGAASTLLGSLLFEDILAISGEELPPELGPEDAQLALAFGAVLLVVFTLGVLALLLLFAFKMRAGRNWARIVLTVVGGVILVIGLLGLGGTFALFGLGALGVLAGLLSLAQLVLFAAAIFFMFRPGASAYFATR